MKCNHPLRVTINHTKLVGCQPTVPLRGLKPSTDLKLRLLAKLNYWRS